MRAAAQPPTAAAAAPIVSESTPTPSTWRSLDEFSRLQAHQLATLSNENGKPYRFTLNLDHEVKNLAERAAKGTATYIGNRLNDAFRQIQQQTNRPVSWWGVIEFSPGADVLHVHGGLVANDNDRPMIKDALRRVAGECSTGAGRWFVHLDGYDDARHYGGFNGALGWVAYAFKDATKTAKRLNRSPVLTSRPLTQIAKQQWEHRRRGGPPVCSYRR